MTKHDEAANLETIARKSLYGAGVNRNMIDYSFRIASRHLTGETILEIGAAEGIMTDLLAATGRRLTVVEGAASFCADLKRRHPDAEIVNALAEDFAPSRRFDNIILGHVLEHVADPVATLRRAATWLTPITGRLFAAVPNARSLHRQAAVVMGMLQREDELNASDIHHGHRRVFDPESFRALFTPAGLSVEIFGGYWLKPVSNRQLEESWTETMLDAFMRLGERYPDIAGEIYVLASRRQPAEPPAVAVSQPRLSLGRGAGMKGRQA